MGGRGKKSKGSKTLIVIDRRGSNDSGNNTYTIFFDHTRNPAGSLTEQNTWKSDQAKATREFERVKKLVSHFAPEQYRLRAKPTNERAGIMPQNPAEYLDHYLAMKQIQVDEIMENIKNKEMMRTVPVEAKTITTAFNGKLFNDGRSAVLSQYSIWCPWYEDSPEHPQAPWPSTTEQCKDGDDRVGRKAATKCGRYLPALRDPRDGSFLHQYPLDQVGPVRVNGPTPMECKIANDDMDGDLIFEMCGRELLGGALYNKIGAWQAPVVPK